MPKDVLQKFLIVTFDKRIKSVCHSWISGEGRSGEDAFQKSCGHLTARELQGTIVAIVSENAYVRYGRLCGCLLDFPMQTKRARSKSQQPFLTQATRVVFNHDLRFPKQSEGINRAIFDEIRGRLERMADDSVLVIPVQQHSAAAAATAPAERPTVGFGKSQSVTDLETERSELRQKVTEKEVEISQFAENQKRAMESERAKYEQSIKEYNEQIKTQKEILEKKEKELDDLLSEKRRLVQTAEETARRAEKCSISLSAQNATFSAEIQKLKAAQITAAEKLAHVESQLAEKERAWDAQRRGFEEINKETEAQLTEYLAKLNEYQRILATQEEQARNRKSQVLKILNLAQNSSAEEWANAVKTVGMLFSRLSNAEKENKEFRNKAEKEIETLRKELSRVQHGWDQEKEIVKEWSDGLLAELDQMRQQLEQAERERSQEKDASGKQIAQTQEELLKAKNELLLTRSKQEETERELLSAREDLKKEKQLIADERKFRMAEQVAKEAETKEAVDNAYTAGQNVGSGAIQKVQSELKAALIKINQLVKSNEESVRSVRSKTVELQAAKAEHSREVTELKGTQEATVRDLRQANQRLLAQMTNLQNKLESKTNEHQKLELDIKKLEKEKQSLARSLREQAQQFTAVENEKDKTLLENNKLLTLKQRQENRFRVLESKINSLETENRQLQDALQSSQSEAKDCKNSAIRLPQIQKLENRSIESLS